MNKATVSKIEVKNVFKIFGNRAKDALAMVGQGKTKDQVLAETGCVVGVNDLSLSIGSGEIFGKGFMNAASVEVPEKYGQIKMTK